MADVLMPRLSDTMAEGVLSQWLKQEGDPVRKGDVLAEIETDKATMELEAYDEGVLERLLVPEGATVPIGQPIAVIGDGTHTSPASVGAAGPGGRLRHQPSRGLRGPAACSRPARPRRARRYGLPRSPARSPAATASTWPPSSAQVRAGGSSGPMSRRPPQQQRAARQLRRRQPRRPGRARAPRYRWQTSRPTTRRSRSPPSAASRHSGSPRARPHRTST